MDPYSGRTYLLGDDLMDAGQVGQLMDLGALRDRAAGLARELTDDERAAILEARALVHVTEEAAQVARVGGRELARRKRRRKAAKASRKANR